MGLQPGKGFIGHSFVVCQQMKVSGLFSFFISQRLNTPFYHLMVIPPLSDYMYHILVFVFVFVPIFVLIFVFAFVFQTERVPAGAGRTLLVSSLSQFKIKSIFHRSTPTQSHTPMFTKLNPNIYKWVKRRRLSYPAEWKTGFVVYIFNALNI